MILARILILLLFLCALTVGVAWYALRIARLRAGEPRPLAELFDEPALQLLGAAHEEAQRFEHERVGPEHLLLTLTRTRSQASGELLEQLGLDPRSLQKDIETRMDRGSEGTVLNCADPFTFETKKVFELAMEESLTSTAPMKVRVEHLLIGVLRGGDEIASRALVDHGVARDAAIL